jgi:hypothetical protein
MIFRSSELLHDRQPEIGDGFSTETNFSSLEKEFTTKEGGKSRLQRPFPRAGQQWQQRVKPAKPQAALLK